MADNRTPREIASEEPLDFDYYSKGDTLDTETVKSFLQEYNLVGGLYCDYYQQIDTGRDMDTVFLEKANKRYEYPIKIKFVFTYLEEVIENINAGIQILDTVDLTVEMDYFKDTTKFEKPLEGSLIFVKYADLWFEVTNVIDSDAVFFGQKLTWKMTAKIYQESGEDQDITNEIFEPGTAPGETDNLGENLLDDVEELSEEMHVYKTGDGGDNIFGNY